VQRVPSTATPQTSAGNTSMNGWAHRTAHSTRSGICTGHSPAVWVWCWEESRRTPIQALPYQSARSGGRMIWSTLCLLRRNVDDAAQRWLAAVEVARQVDSRHMPESGSMRPCPCEGIISAPVVRPKQGLRQCGTPYHWTGNSSEADTPAVNMTQRDGWTLLASYRCR
jgi:hypothetical protein